MQHSLYRVTACAMALAVFGVSVPALADSLSAVSTPATSAVDLDNLVVTATRTASTLDQTLIAVNVIDRQQIDRLQPASLSDLLRGLPGVSISNSGGLGKSTSLFLRGTQSDHVLVMVDGIRAGSATTGGFAWQDIPVEQIERIEIVRGPFSSLYGSSAIGGVVQIFTRRPKGAFAPHLSLAAGSERTWRRSARIGGRGDSDWYSINLTNDSSDGIDAFGGDPARLTPERYLDPDLDGYRNSSLTVQGGYQFDPQWDAEANLLRAQSHNKYDGSSNNESDGVQQVLGARLRHTPDEQLTVLLSAGRSEDRSDAFLDGVYSSTFDSRRDQGSLQTDMAITDGLLTLGFDWLRDRVDSSSTYQVNQRSNRALFGQWQQQFDRHALQASLRRDDNSQFGAETTGSALWRVGLGDTLSATVSVGSAFKAPTFNELYFPGYGNPDLAPESSRSVEIGLRGEHGRASWALSAFKTRIDDLIAYDSTLVDDAHPFGQPNNIERARIRGIELSSQARVMDWDLSGSASWLEPRNDGQRFSGNVLPRRARQTARIDADRRVGAFALGASLHAIGARFDDLGNTRRLHGYSTTDLRISYAAGTDWSLRLSAANVFDRSYETAAFFNQPGRTWLLNLRYSPGAIN